MALEEVGVSLIADGGDRYINTLTQATAAETKLASAAAPAVAGINALDDQLGSAAKQLDMFAGDASLAAKDAALLGNTSDSAGADVLGLGKDADTAGAGVDDFGNAAKKGGKSSKQLGDDAEQGSKGVSLLDKVATGAAEKIGHLLVEGAAQAGQAILKFVGDSIGAAGDFEAGMNDFSAVVGSELDSSGKSLSDFKDLFISLGRDLPVSTQEVQQAAIEMSKGGIEPAVIAGGALRQTLQFAAASGLGLADAAQISAKVLGGWTSLAASAADKAAFFTSSTDLLTKATSAAATNVDQLSLGLFNVQGQAQSTGVSFNDTVTTLALLTPSFNSSATAGDSMKNMLSSLQPKSDAAADAMKSLNLLTGEGKSVFYDATGAFVGMRKATDILHTAFEGLSDAEKSERLQTIFGNDAKNAANALIRAGVEGYDEITKKIAAQNGVLAQAKIKQQGYNVAMDNLMGSLEALQITVTTAALPALTKLLGGLASGVNAITAYADATIKGESALAKIAGTIQSLAVPALAAVTAATIAYAVANSSQLLLSLALLSQRLPLLTGEMIANAGATALAAAPYIAIAAAIGVAVYAMQQYDKVLQDATTQMLEGKQWWTDSATALENFTSKTDEGRSALEPYAATITELRTEIESDTKALGDHEAAFASFGAASGYSREQLDAELASIVAKKDGLIEVTHAYNTQEQAIINQTAASLTATNVTTTLTDKMNALGDGASLTDADIQKLTKTIEDNAQKGQDAVQKYATTYSEFVTGVEQRADEHAKAIADLEAKKQKATTAEQKKGIDDQIAQVEQSYKDQEGAAATSYAAQQEAQRQHLGQMLIDYTVAQAQLAGSDKERKDRLIEVTKALEVEYGLQQSSVASTYLEMTSSIDQFSHDAGSDIHTLIGDLRDQSQQAEDTQKKMDDAFKDRTYEITSNFIEAKGDADDYARALESIPKEINTTVTTTYRDKQDNRGDDSSQQSPGRASGGPVDAGHAYLVGEHGPETIVPAADGYVLTASETRRAQASGAQLGASRSGSIITETTIINVDARGSSLTMADITHGVRAGLESVGRSADAQVRTLG